MFPFNPLHGANRAGKFAAMQLRVGKEDLREFGAKAIGSGIAKPYDDSIQPWRNTKLSR